MRSKCLIFYFISLCLIFSAMVLFLGSPLAFADSGGGNAAGMTVSGVLPGQVSTMGYLNNMWGSSDSSFMGLPWANWGQSQWGNMPGMMTDLDAYSGVINWGQGIVYNPVDLMKTMNQLFNNYMILLNQTPFGSRYLIPPAGQAAIKFGPERLILPKIFDPRWPSPIPIEDRYWVGYCCFMPAYD